MVSELLQLPFSITLPLCHMDAFLNIFFYSKKFSPHKL